MAVFRNRGFRITPLPVCPDITKPSRMLASSLYASGAKLASLQDAIESLPLGMTMPLSMRVRLIKAAPPSAMDIFFEDDYCREFRYTERPIPSL